MAASSQEPAGSAASRGQPGPAGASRGGRLWFCRPARRPGSDLSLLQELQSRMRRSKQGRPARRSGTTDADCLQQLSRGDRGPEAT